MTWTQKDIPDQTGRIAVVTGANGGLGLATAKALAAKNATVVMAARNQTKAESARDQILAEHPNAALDLVELDLANQASVKAAAADIADRYVHVDILVNNAGLMAMPESATDDGYEMQFGVNHLGHWTFVGGLMSSIVNASDARVVTVTSVARHQGKPVDPTNPHMRGNYDPWQAYGQAKLANFHFALGLQARFEEAGVSAASLAAHPGLSNTDLQSTTVDAGGGGLVGTVSHSLARFVGMAPDVGARPQLRAATDPGAKGGELYGPLFGASGPPIRQPIVRDRGGKAAIDTLWTVSEAETGVAIEVPSAGSSRG